HNRNSYFFSRNSHNTNSSQVGHNRNSYFFSRNSHNTNSSQVGHNRNSSFLKEKSYNTKGMMSFNIANLIQLILLVIAIILLVSLVREFGYPHKQSAFANIEMLRLSMNKACIEGSTSIDGFELPQNIPPDFGGVYDIFPRIFITTNGDPSYLLYYENFPAGEAIGWEAYTRPNTRLIMPVSDEINEMNVNEASLFLKDQRHEILGKFYEANKLAGFSAVLDTVLYSNIVLQNVMQENTIGQRAQELAPSLGILGDVGYWEDKGFYKFYKFQTYGLVPAVNKTQVKYRSCGPGNLCLKTKEGIYAFPLDACNGKIDYVQLIYDVKNPNAFIKGAKKSVLGWAGLKAALVIGLRNILGKWLFLFSSEKVVSVGIDFLKSFYVEKTSDFYLASPCEYKGRIEIERGECTTGDFGCKNMIKYPIYNVMNDNLEKVGEHYTCLDSIGVLGGDYGDVETKGISCLKVKFISDTPKNNFCWTLNSRKSILGGQKNVLQPVGAIAAYNKNYKGVFVAGGDVHDILLGKYTTWFGKAMEKLIQYLVPVKWTWPGTFYFQYSASQEALK
ncbi:MAG: hypothetical protein HZB65_04750, partial [Candidatus Aenigmarchaeota archaeon]|nr:hypothetical protein [Candidatus Aenigmarchaeota archaeon]